MRAPVVGRAEEHRCRRKKTRYAFKHAGFSTVVYGCRRILGGQRVCRFIESPSISGKQYIININ